MGRLSRPASTSAFAAVGICAPTEFASTDDSSFAHSRGKRELCLEFSRRKLSGVSNLLLIKHSEPVVDLGITPANWGLSDRGKQRAGLLAAYLADRKINALYSSSEVKAVQTAEIVASSTGLSINVVHDLREHDRENTPVEEAEKWRSLVVESIRKQDEQIYGSETVGTARMRFAKAIERLVKSDSGQNVAVIAHGTVISTFVAELLEIDPIPIWESLGLPGLLEVEWPHLSRILTRRNFE